MDSAKLREVSTGMLALGSFPLDVIEFKALPFSSSVLKKPLVLAIPQLYLDRTVSKNAIVLSTSIVFC